MCDLNGPFRLCTCSSNIDFTKPHWILRMNSHDDGKEILITVGMMIPPNLIDKIERRKVLRRLNTVNVFDFNYTPEENDQLELNFEENDGFKFTFRKGKWVFEEFLGEHPMFKHESLRIGIIESKNSKLKEVCRVYISVLEEGEMDIVDCGWSNYRLSEKKLIQLLEKRIKGEKIELPDGNLP